MNPRRLAFFGLFLSGIAVFGVWCWRGSRNQTLISPLPDQPRPAALTQSTPGFYSTPVALPVIAATPVDVLAGAAVLSPPPIVRGGNTPRPSGTPVAGTTPSPSIIKLATVIPTPRVTSLPTVASTPVGTAVPAAILDSLFSRYSSEFQVDIWLLRRLAVCESGYNYLAINGPYAGMFQFSVGTWVATRNRMVLDPNPTLRLNPEEAIRTAAFKISRDGMSAWPNCK